MLHTPLNTLATLDADQDAPLMVSPPADQTHVAWYVTGTREDGVPCCDVYVYWWDEQGAIWIARPGRTTVTDGGIVEQRCYGGPVGIRLGGVRGRWTIRHRFFRTCGH